MMVVCRPTTVAGGGRKCYDFCGRLGFDEAQVEVRDVLNKHATQLPLVQDQYVIQTLGSDRSHPSLRDGVGLGRSELIRGCRQADAYLLKLFAGVVPSQMKPAAVTSVTVVT